MINSHPLYVPYNQNFNYSNSANSVLGMDVDKYIFGDNNTQIQPQQQVQNNQNQQIQQTNSQKKDKTAGILVLGALALGAYFGIKHGKGLQITKAAEKIAK